MNVLRFIWIRIKALGYQPCHSHVKGNVNYDEKSSRLPYFSLPFIQV